MDPRTGLCSICAHVRRIRNARGSVFHYCRRADADPRFARYPALPVVRCAGFVAGDTVPDGAERSS